MPLTSQFDRKTIGLNEQRYWAAKENQRRMQANPQYLEEKYKETEPPPKEENTSYIKSCENIEIRQNKSIYIGSYEEKKKAYNTTMFDPDRKYSDK